MDLLDDYKRKATIWLNGTPTTLTDGTYNAEAHGIVVSGNDVYTVGHEMNEYGNTVAILWKNGEVIKRSSKITFKNGGDIVLVLSKGFNVASSKSVYVTGKHKKIVNNGKFTDKFI